jgi:hypothetical protein
MFAAAKTGGVVASSGDPYWTSVSLLTNFENNLTFQDGSTNNFAITRTGVVNPSLNTPFSGVGGSEYFNGASGSYLSVPRNAAFLPVANEDFTFEAWVYLTATPTAPVIGAQIVGFGEYGLDSDWVFGVTSSLQASLYLNATITSYTNTTTLLLNTWNHVAASRSGTGTNNLKVFVNGVGTSFTTNSTTVFSGLRNLTIGADQNGDEAILTGFISNLRIVKGTAVYTANFTPPTAPLTAITNTSLLITGTGQGMFDNSTFVDQGPNALTVTATGSPVYSGLSPFGNTYAGSVLYSATANYLSTPDSAVLQLASGDLTVEFWINYTSIAGYQTIYNKGYVTAGAFLFQTGLGDGKLNFYAGGVLTIASGTADSVGSWVHYALVRSGTTVTLYRNGTSVGSATNSTNFNSTAVLYIGTGNVVGPGNLNLLGYISNLRIVKGTAVYTANFTPPTTPLTAITNTSLLVRGDTGAFYDLSNNGLAETGTGTPAVTTQVKKFGNESGFLNGSSYLSVANSTALQFGSGNATIEFWINVTSTAGVQQIFNTGSGPSTNLSYAMIISTGSLLYYLSSNGATWDIASGVTVGSITANTWTYVALVRSGNTWTPYVNSVAGTTTTNAAALFNFTSAIPIGQSAGAQYVTGYLDDIRFTKGVARTITTPTATFPTGP